MRELLKPQALGARFAVLGLIVVGTFAPPCSSTTGQSVAVRNLSHAKQLSLGVRLYAEDHQGRYPVHLNELAPEYVARESLLDLSFGTSTDNRSQTADWLYFGAFLDEAHPPAVLIAAPLVHPRKKRIVITPDGSGRIAMEAEYQALLRKTIGQLQARAAELARPVSPGPGTIPSPTPPGQAVD